MHVKKRPSDENELLVEEWVGLGLQMGCEAGVGHDFRRSLETSASQTITVSSRVKASRDRAGRNKKRSPWRISSGVGKACTSAGACVETNPTSHMVTDRDFTVANRTHSL